MLFVGQVAVTAVAMSFDKDQALENGRHSGEKTQIKGELFKYIHVLQNSVKSSSVSR